jgi:chromosome segregation ATPase
MDETLVAAVAAATTTLGAALGGFWGRRSRGEKDANSAVLLSRAYALSVDSQNKLVDNQQQSLEDARKHIHRQDAEFAKMRERHADELREVREELRTVRDARAIEHAELEALRGELVAVRTENAALRSELAAVRAENPQLVARIATLEAQRPTPA